MMVPAGWVGDSYSSSGPRCSALFPYLIGQVVTHSRHFYYEMLPIKKITQNCTN
jgi:hypothetical protein